MKKGTHAKAEQHKTIADALPRPQRVSLQTAITRIMPWKEERGKGIMWQSSWPTFGDMIPRWPRTN